MATIRDWRYVLPHRKFEQVLFIGENVELYEPILSILSCEEGRELSIHGLGKGAELPDKAADLTIIDTPPDAVNFFIEFSQLPVSGGLLFVRITGRGFKKAESILGSLDWAWISSYVAFPSFENPWYIVPLNGHHVLTYAVRNVFSSRSLLRRLILRGALILARFGLTNSLMAWLPCIVTIAEKNDSRA